MSLNGQIAREDDSADWSSKEDGQAFVSTAKRVGVIIIGRRTYDIIKKAGKQIPDILTIVLTRNPALVSESPNTIITTDSLREVLGMLEKKGHKEVLIGGGSMMNASFITENLIDEIQITVEPMVLGRGIPLFFPESFERRLRLLETKKLNESTIQLHYEVVK